MPKLIGDKPLTPAERQKRYRERHPDRVKNSIEKYKKNNPEAIKEASKRYYYRNAEAEKARSIRWRKLNHENWRKIANASWARRKARKLNAGVFVILDRELMRILSSPCNFCGTTEDITLDHVIPLARGGRHSIGNLQPLCGTCNKRKNSKLMSEWRYIKRANN